MQIDIIKRQSSRKYKKSFIKRRLILISIGLAVIVGFTLLGSFAIKYFSSKNNSENDSLRASTLESKEKSNITIQPEKEKSNDNANKIKEESSNEQNNKKVNEGVVSKQQNNKNKSNDNINTYKIQMNSIMQTPELPTGCEVTSLTMVLNHLGYNVSKTTLAKDYLPKDVFDRRNGVLYGPDFKTTFAGDPFTAYGCGCLAPAIVTTANNYLKAVSGKAKVNNVSGTTPSKLYDYIKKGIPVIVWVTIDMEETYEGDSWYTPDGRYITFKAPEHCLVLTGVSGNEVIVNDPLVGATTYSKDLFETRYTQMGSQAVVITK